MANPPGTAVAAIAPVAGILPHSVGPYLVMMCLGFGIGAYGHLARLRWMVAVGILLILLATLIFPLAVVVTNNSPAPPPPDQFPGYTP